MLWLWRWLEKCLCPYLPWNSALIQGRIRPLGSDFPRRWTNSTKCSYWKVQVLKWFFQEIQNPLFTFLSEPSEIHMRDGFAQRRGDYFPGSVPLIGVCSSDFLIYIAELIDINMYIFLIISNSFLFFFGSHPSPPPPLSSPHLTAFNYLIFFLRHLKAECLKYKSPPNHYMKDLSALFRAMGLRDNEICWEFAQISHTTDVKMGKGKGGLEKPIFFLTGKKKNLFLFFSLHILCRLQRAGEGPSTGFKLCSCS